MDQNTHRTPHPEDPAEGASDIDGADDATTSTGGDRHAGGGDPSTIPEHNTAPDGFATADGPHGGAIQGDASDGGTGGAIQGDAGPDRQAPLGGHETTEEQLDADNEVEGDTLKTLDPDDPPA